MLAIQTHLEWYLRLSWQWKFMLWSSKLWHQTAMVLPFSGWRWRQCGPQTLWSYHSTTWYHNPEDHDMKHTWNHLKYLAYNQSHSTNIHQSHCYGWLQANGHSVCRTFSLLQLSAPLDHSGHWFLHCAGNLVQSTLTNLPVRGCAAGVLTTGYKRDWAQQIHSAHTSKHKN
jgi:hypothetical protein